MKYIIVPLALLGVVAALPLNGDEYAPVVRQELQINPDGTHSYLYETGNGIYEDQQGYPKGPDSQAAQGQFQYRAPDGQVIRLTYVADENGFQPQGDHLPTPPPVPAGIQRALDFLTRIEPRSQGLK